MAKKKLSEKPLRKNPALLESAVSTLKDCDNFRTMSAELLGDLLRSGSYLEAPEGTTLIEEGATGDDVFFLLEGQLDVNSEEKLILTLDQPGDIIGELAVVSPAARSADVRAALPSRLVRFSTKEVMGPDSDPVEANQFLTVINHIMAAKLRKTSLRAKLYEDAVMEAEAFATSNVKLETEIQDRLQEVTLYSKLVEAGNDAVLISNLDGTIQQHNPKAAEVFSGDKKMLDGGKVLDLVKDFSLGDFPKGPISEPWKGEWVRGEGTRQLIFQTSVFPILGKDGAPVAVAYQFHDVSTERTHEQAIAAKNEEIRKALSDLEATFEELQRSDRLKMESLTVISDELAAPIRKILNHSTKLVDTFTRPLRPELINQVNLIQDQAHFIKAISENIDHLIDIESAAPSSTTEGLNVNDVVNEVCGELKSKGKRKNVSLEIILPEEPLMLEGDGERFKVMLNVLVEQALLAAHVRSKLVVRGELLEKMDQVHLELSYNGPEVTSAPNKANSQNQMSLLIGLPLARRVISQHQGSMQFLKDGPKSRISILLPLKRKEGAERPNRIMIADEREMDRLIVRGVIEHQWPGSVVLESSEPFEFLEAYDDFGPDLVIIDPDFQEPGWSNHRVMSDLSQTRRHVCPVLAVSGLYQDFAERTIAIERGVADFLAKPYSIFDMQFKVNSLIASHRKVETLHETADQAQRQAQTDGLTKLANRKNFDSFLETQVNYSLQTQKPCSMIMMDVDNFKHYNDTNGHQSGDEVLKGVSRILEQSVRSSDLPARYGGEEFAIVLPETRKEMAVVIAEKMRRAISEMDFPSAESQPLGFVSASFGVSTLGEDAEDGVSLIKAADDALYEAKARGRNAVVTASPPTPQAAAN